MKDGEILTKEYIRYLDSEGNYKYPSVKDVGVIEELKTKSTNSIVEAINELIDISDSKDTENLSTIISNIQNDISIIQNDMLESVNIINENYNNILEPLRELQEVASQHTENFKNYEYNFTNIEGKLNNTISSKEFNNAIGLNQWRITTYNSKSSINEVVNSKDIYNAKKMNIYDVDDSQHVELNSGLSMYKTFVYVEDDSTIIFGMENTGNVNVYMNGASVYSEIREPSEMVSISMSLNKGWNSIEIIVSNDSDSSTIKMATPLLSNIVDKMTTVIGVGTANETQYTELMTTVEQTLDSINLMATKDVVEGLGHDVTSMKASVVVMAEKIENTVSKDSMNDYTGRVESIESNFVQLNNEITGKVSSNLFDTLNDKVISQDSIIKQLENSINLAVDKTTYDSLKEVVEANKSSLEILNNEISSMVSETEFNEKLGLYETTFSEILQTAESISSTIANQNEAISNISQTYSEIVNQVYNADGTSKIQQKFDEITSVVSEIGSMSIGGNNIIDGTNDYRFSSENANWVIEEPLSDRNQAKIITFEG